MRVIKGLLLGAAAGLVATAGAQAADLPVKAKPVEYVKICSAYGAGFYYIPGTDICLRVGGYVFFEWGVKAFNGVPRIYQNTPFDADFNYTNYRSRGHVILDARTNTAYGTLRSYAAFGVSNQTGPTSGAGSTVASLDRAFIEFAGFTFGFTESFFSFAGTYSQFGVASLSWQWLNLAAYTANLGNGVSATISFEDNSTRAGIASGAFTGAIPGSGAGYGGNWAPNVVGNIAVRQAWGRAQVMGAVQQIKPSVALQANPAIESEYGWAVGAGIELKTPSIAPNNSWVLQGAYSEGALEYLGVSASPGAAAAGIGHVNTNGIGPVFDYFDAFASATGLNLSEGWSAYTAYRHYWTPMLRTSLYAGYLEIDPGSGGFDPDLELWQAGIHTIWSPVSGLDIGLDVMYSDISTGSCVGNANPSVVAFNCNRSDGVWSVWNRIRRNF